MRVTFVIGGYARDPVVLVGHSFGGLLAIAYTLRHPDHIDRAVFSAPLLIPKVKVPAWKRPLTKVLPRLAPRVAVSNEVDANLLSHDPQVARRYASDPLVHDRITGGLYGDTIARGEEFIARAGEIRVPFLLMQGRDDRIVDPLGSQRFFAAACVANVRDRGERSGGNPKGAVQNQLLQYAHVEPTPRLRSVRAGRVHNRLIPQSEGK